MRHCRLKKVTAKTFIALALALASTTAESVVVLIETGDPPSTVPIESFELDSRAFDSCELVATTRAGRWFIAADSQKELDEQLARSALEKKGNAVRVLKRQRLRSKFQAWAEVYDCPEPALGALRERGR